MGVVRRIGREAGGVVLRVGAVGSPSPCLRGCGYEADVAEAVFGACGEVGDEAVEVEALTEEAEADV